MALQKDLIPGFDFSGLSSTTFAQIWQSIANLAPLANIGGVIFSSTAPDVINNPRFARYIWLNSVALPPVPKFWDGAAWQSVVIADGSITNAKLANTAVSILTSGGVSTRIARAYAGTADATKAAYILRLDANGQYVEIVPLSTLLAAGTVSISALAAGTDNYILRMDGVVPVWENINFANELAVASVTGDKLTDDSILLAKLKKSESTALQVWRKNAANNAYESALPVISREATVLDGAVFPAGAAVRPLAHGFGNPPKIFRVVIRCSTDDSAATGYVVGDEVNIESVYRVDGGVNDGAPIVTVFLNSVDNNVNAAVIGSVAHIRHKVTSASSPITRANWTLKCYCFI